MTDYLENNNSFLYVETKPILLLSISTRFLTMGANTKTLPPPPLQVQVCCYSIPQTIRKKAELKERKPIYRFNAVITGV